MLAYRHHFHAGNAADVFKHALLCQLLLGMARKDKPFLYLESHAGIGRYDLKHPWAQKNREYEQGITRVLARNDAPESMRPYLDAVAAENQARELHIYPGSPLLARRLLRPGDRMVLAELNREDHAQLAAMFDRDRAVQVRHMDGYQALKAFLPPQERRGLILIDSSFDRSREFSRLLDAIAQACRRFATGVYAIWYPLMDPAVIRGFERDMVRTGLRKVLRLELALHPDNWQEGVRGSAMLVINPPFGLDETARDLLPWLWSVLSPEAEGRHSVRWLVEE
jgi:23S rRNA (adenine2030-N6)-methyltransferase